MLESIGSEIWIADGSTVDFYGFAYPTRMAVVRLENGDLWLWSPIALTAELAGEVSALGSVRHLVSPNKIHHLFLGEWQEAFPEARIWGTASTIAKRGDLAFAGALADAPPSDWAGQIDQFYFDNSRFMDELIFFHRASRTAIIADLSENFSEAFLARNWSWWQRPIARLWKIVEGWGYAPLEYRLSFRRRDSARSRLHALIDAAPEHVVVAHGEIARSDGGAYLRRAFAWLL